MIVPFQPGSVDAKARLITERVSKILGQPLVMINKPGAGMATLDNPYGNKGFSSIQWWYATLIQRPERLGLILTVAPVL